MKTYEKLLVCDLEQHYLNLVNVSVTHYLMPGVCMASAVGAALVDMPGTVSWTIQYGVHWTMQGFIPLKTNPLPSIGRKTTKRRVVDFMGQRKMSHMGCNRSGYICDFTYCVHFISARSCSRTRCDAQGRIIRGSVTTHEFVPLAIEASCVFNSEELEFVKKFGDRLSNASSEEKETACLFQRISVAFQRGNSISFLGSQK